MTAHTHHAWHNLLMWHTRMAFIVYHAHTGEYWDSTEHMDTYYNPVPHFG